MKWRDSQNDKVSKKKKIQSSKCVGIMHAQFTNNEEVYIIALSGPGYKPSSNDISQLEPTGYHETWKELMKNPRQLLDVPENVIVAEFDAVHKDCLAKYNNKIINDKIFFEQWVQRLDNWIKEWHNQFKEMIKAKKNLQSRSLLKKA